MMSWCQAKTTIIVFNYRLNRSQVAMSFFVVTIIDSDNQLEGCKLDNFSTDMLTQSLVAYFNSRSQFSIH